MAEQKQKIGQDEWVDSFEERAKRQGGLRGLLTRAQGILPVWAWLLVILGVCALIPLLEPNALVMRVLTDIALMAILAIGLNVVAGYSGLLDLGYVAFFGVGAYTYAYLSSDFTGIFAPSIFSIFLAIALGAFIGLILGASSLRLTGDYLAIVTLGFGLAFVNLLRGLTRVDLPGAEEPVNLTNGINGINRLGDLSLFGLEASTTTHYYYLMLIALMLVLLIVYHINKSPLGRAWRSMREDELATKAMGMDTRWLKLQAFMIGAGIAAFAGAMQAAYKGFVFPSNFNTDVLITVYAVVVLGGLGSLPGVVLGAIIMVATPEILRNPTIASLFFYSGVIVILWTTLKPRIQTPLLIAAMVVFGIVVNFTGGLFIETTTLESFEIPDVESVGTAISVMLLTARNLLRDWLFVPEATETAGNWAFVLMFVGILFASRIKEMALRFAVLVPTLYLLVMAWELRMSVEPSVTRILFIGILLVVLMIYRPSGLLGRKRVEIV
jgi:branched-chain amino acid transport system permease protein